MYAEVCMIKVVLTKIINNLLKWQHCKEMEDFLSLIEIEVTERLESGRCWRLMMMITTNFAESLSLFDTLCGLMMNETVWMCIAWLRRQACYIHDPIHFIKTIVSHSTPLHFTVYIAHITHRAINQERVRESRSSEHILRKAASNY